MIPQTQHNTAWGVELGTEAVRLVRLTRTGDGYHADRFRQAPLDTQRLGSAALAEAIGRLADGPVDGPVVVCLPDERVVHRTLSLPAADREALGKMVAGQMEVLFGAQADQLVAAWHAYDSGGRPTCRVWLAAGRADAVARAVEACRRLGGAGVRIIPTLSALAALWQGTPQAAGAVALVGAAAGCTAMAVAVDGRVLRCGVVEAPAEASAFHLRELFDHCTADLEDGERPARCIVFGPADPESVASALGLPAVAAQPPAAVRLAEDVPFVEAAPAIGAALGALAADAPLLALNGSMQAGASAAAARPGRARLRWAAVIAWVAVALVALYGADRARARRLATAVEDFQARTGGPAGLARQEAVGDWLQANGPTPLEALDVIVSVLPDKTVLSNWSLGRSRSGTSLSLEGKVPDDKTFQTLLSAAMDLGEVAGWKLQPDKDGVKFEIRIELDRRANDRLIRRCASATSQPAKETQPAKDTQPASGPAGARAEGGAS
ncbi:MAG: hypothetical protein GX591_06510 [Planctomycetes bacterium]|nr:hypothetical protein [Planctomycetota bacterium]